MDGSEDDKFGLLCIVRKCLAPNIQILYIRSNPRRRNDVPLGAGSRIAFDLLIDYAR